MAAIQRALKLDAEQWDQRAEVMATRIGNAIGKALGG